ncbi:hypothetical protein K458DRAFT_417405 [Lentithecium fluviatile CBS 122367]|uniref:Uncharacterized protein n=1 Tax=Lentithecium fluviatile CBS 122367 TaxID=1168545 RepID=A0A6G1J562_9PLEO|nr:hypothetical protein K458DRAFT_417405 [Lentithecium fluviatile CBS 122367]
MCNGTVVLPATTSSASPTPTSTPTSGTGDRPDETCPTVQALEASLDTKRNTVTGLAVALGCMGLALGVLGWDWNRKRKLLVLPPAMRMRN